MSGGSINLVNSTGTTSADYNQTGTMVYSGGTLNFGTAATATNFTFRAQGQMPYVVIDNTTNAKVARALAARATSGALSRSTRAPRST